ncbi:MAG TPA: hypothetical protein VFC44_01675 [Candidatus Saccharimonadales bacterium]|nr:hypothetical protein [Candidatus Saccharimonadales bacterium]
MESFLLKNVSPYLKNMKRIELEHIIRAASVITNQADIVIIGSQAILGQFPNADPALLVSMEADVFPLHRPDLSIGLKRLP